ncbi:hypothetical protein GZ78_01345 [Endozoicomonas numazuensis]|uniref:Uncharacterized protein n=1 Tax=Endozoicomonas numazuensis TaxID=1137799 RepID=A0A081NJZ2_9GAMM|nr:hypothetical protein GZ78_01345 [Endozoicomonas numazuensis]
MKKLTRSTEFYARTLFSVSLLELDTIFKKYGTELADEEYISLPEWEKVLDAAKPDKQTP